MTFCFSLNRVKEVNSRYEWRPHNTHRGRNPTPSSIAKPGAFPGSTTHFRACWQAMSVPWSCSKPRASHCICHHGGKAQSLTCCPPPWWVGLEVLPVYAVAGVRGVSTSSFGECAVFLKINWGSFKHPMYFFQHFSFFPHF